MKKLMFAAAALTAGFAMAEIVSSDIVGYAQSALQSGATMTTPQFLNVGTSAGMPLQSIKPTGDDTSDNVNIQLLDSYGRTLVTYLWVNWAGDNGDQEAWVDDNEFAIVEDVTIAPGQGLWVTGSSAEQAFQSAGSVGKSDVSVQLCSGATGIGNPFPVAIDLQDITPIGDDTSDNVNIQFLDTYGRTLVTYLWVNWAGDNGDQEAWVDDNEFAIVENVTIAPGQGLWVTGSSDTQYLQFPAPEL